MSGQIQKERQKSEAKVEEPAPVEAKSLENKELSSDIDDLLDEIDAVLESNAEEFVKAYVQKGGQ